MIIIDKPYVSNFLIETIRKNKLPVLENEYSSMYRNEITPYLLVEEDFKLRYLESNNPKIYSSSENSIGWILASVQFSDLAKKINLFKNKINFRALTSKLYPDFYFREVQMANLDDVSFEELPLPFIIKPSTGFFSMGVYKVDSEVEWEQTKKNILIEMKKVAHLYPTEVLDPNSFIIEQCVSREKNLLLMPITMNLEIRFF